MTTNSEENVINMIRQRTEEEELKQHLKTTVGGYTKNSVMEYLSDLRKRQQNSSETFNEHMQSLLEEKESLKTENEKLLMQVAQAKAEFHRMADSRKQQEQSKLEAANNHAESLVQREPIKAETVNDNVFYLKNHTPAFDTADTNPQNADSTLEKKIDALKNEISEKDAELEKTKQDIKVHKELLANEKLEAKKQRDLVTELSATSEKFKEERKYLKAELVASVEQQDCIISQLKSQLIEKDSKINTLSEENKQFAVLTASVEQQDKIISQLKAEAADKDNTVKILLEENITMMQSMELMSNSLDNMEIQNEKLVTANNALGQAFEDENKKVVKLINEKSEETVEKLILARKLEEIIGNLSAYELSKSGNAETNKNAESKTSIA